MEFTVRQAKTRLVEKSSRHKLREIGTAFPRKAARGTTLLRQQKRGFANAESVAARLVPPQSQSATKSLEPPSFTDSETRISYCRGRDGLKTKGNAKLTVLGHNQEHGRTPVAMLECSTERERDSNEGKM